MENVPQLIEQYIFGWTDNVYLILFIMNVIFLFMGTWLETAASIILLGPVFGPALVNLGVHPVHVGMIMIVISQGITEQQPRTTLYLKSWCIAR